MNWTTPTHPKHALAVEAAEALRGTPLPLDYEERKLVVAKVLHDLKWEVDLYDEVFPIRAVRRTKPKLELFIEFQAGGEYKRRMAEVRGYALFVLRQGQNKTSADGKLRTVGPFG